MTQNKSNSLDRAATHRQKRALPVVLAMAGLLTASALVVPPLFSSKQAIAATTGEIMQVAPTGFADLVDRVKPSVVSIKVQHKSRRYHSDRRREYRRREGRGGEQRREGRQYGERRRDFGNLPEDHPLRDFFERFNRGPGPQFRGNPRRRSRAVGSGFIISSDGYVVTNHHVVDNNSRVQVTLDGGKTYDAKVIGTDKKTDLAVLKIKADRTFKPVKFAKKEARVGDWVVAVGNPFGLGGTVTTGVVSARGRAIGNGPYDDYLQIDAAINRGNSGGPAFNLQGEVIGVNTAIYSPTGGNVGIGFAIPASLASDVIAKLRSGGKITRGWLGVQIQPVSDDIAESLGLDSNNGALVVQVTKDSPAAAAGFKTGDAILEVNGQTVKSPRDLARKVARIRPGANADIKLMRNGETITKSVKIKTLPGSGQLASRSSDDDDGRRDRVAALGLELRADREGDSVVVLDVDPDSAAASKGLRRGDKIIEVAGLPVKSPGDVKRQLEKASKKGRKAVLMLVRTRDTERFIALPLKRV